MKWLKAMLFVVAALLAAQVLPLTGFGASWRGTAMILPGLSPFAAVGGAIASRAVSGFMLLGLPVIFLGLWKRRWFCARACPTGFACELAGRLNGRAAGRHLAWPEVGPLVAAAGLCGAIAGYPLFLFLDPLAMFNGFFGALKYPVVFPVALSGVGFLVVVLLSALRPGLWCYRICPLGGLQEALWAVRRQIRAGRSVSGGGAGEAAGDPVNRRAFIAMAGAGAAGAVAGRLVGRRKPAIDIIRPPGSIEESAFPGVCERCGNCARACPQGIIRPDLGAAGLAGLMAPVVGYGVKTAGDIGPGGYCGETCAECCKVCPTGAIRRMPLEEKSRAVMGTAVIGRATCIAWQGGFCMVCDEVCHYKAIRSVENGGVNCPEVIVSACRGCGKCQVYCPSEPWPSIVVHSRAVG